MVPGCRMERCAATWMVSDPFLVTSLDLRAVGLSLPLGHHQTAGSIIGDETLEVRDGTSLSYKDRSGQGVTPCSTPDPDRAPHLILHPDSHLTMIRACSQSTPAFAQTVCPSDQVEVTKGGRFSAFATWFTLSFPDSTGLASYDGSGGHAAPPITTEAGNGGHAAPPISDGSGGGAAPPIAAATAAEFEELLRSGLPLDNHSVQDAAPLPSAHAAAPLPSSHPTAAPLVAQSFRQALHRSDHPEDVSPGDKLLVKVLVEPQVMRTVKFAEACLCMARVWPHMGHRLQTRLAYLASLTSIVAAGRAPDSHGDHSTHGRNTTASSNRGSGSHRVICGHDRRPDLGFSRSCGSCPSKVCLAAGLAVRLGLRQA